MENRDVANAWDALASVDDRVSYLGDIVAQLEDKLSSVRRPDQGRPEASTAEPQPIQQATSHLTDRLNSASTQVARHTERILAILGDLEV